MSFNFGFVASILDSSSPHPDCEFFLFVKPHHSLRQKIASLTQPPPLPRTGTRPGCGFDSPAMVGAGGSDLSSTADHVRIDNKIPSGSRSRSPAIGRPFSAWLPGQRACLCCALTCHAHSILQLGGAAAGRPNLTGGSVPPDNGLSLHRGLAHIALTGAGPYSPSQDKIPRPARRFAEANARPAAHRGAIPPQGGPHRFSRPHRRDTVQGRSTPELGVRFQRPSDAVRGR